MPAAATVDRPAGATTRATSPRPPEYRSALEHELRDLHRVRRGSLAQLVAHHPEAQPVRMREILAHPSDEAVVLPLDLDRRGITLLGRLVAHAQPRKPREQIARPGRRDLLLGLDVHGH